MYVSTSPSLLSTQPKSYENKYEYRDKEFLRNTKNRTNFEQIYLSIFFIELINDA